MLWKCCTQYASKFGELSSGHRTGKGQFSFQSQRKAMPKNVQTTAQLHSSHMLAKSWSKFSKPGFNSTWMVNFQMFKLGLEKAEEPEIKLPTSVGSLKKQENSRKTSTSALLTMPKTVTMWITIDCGKFLKRWEYQTTWPAIWETCIQAKKHQLELNLEQKIRSVTQSCPTLCDPMNHSKLWEMLKEMGIPDHHTCPLRNLYAGQEATVRTGHGTTDWFQIGKGVHQGCILSPCLFNLYAEYNMRNAGLDEA